MRNIEEITHPFTYLYTYKIVKPLKFLAIFQVILTAGKMMISSRVLRRVFRYKFINISMYSHLFHTKRRTLIQHATISILQSNPISQSKYVDFSVVYRRLSISRDSWSTNWKIRVWFPAKKGNCVFVRNIRPALGPQPPGYPLGIGSRGNGTPYQMENAWRFIP
jgi:hypothetical protein